MNFVMLNIGGLCCKGYDYISFKKGRTTYYKKRLYYIYPNGRFYYVFHNAKYFFYYVDNILSQCIFHDKDSAEYMSECYFCEKNNNKKFTIINSLIDGKHVCLKCFKKRSSRYKKIEKERIVKKQEQLTFW